MKVAIIPARGGSKRIPRKNIRPFAGKPMIVHAIDAARHCSLFDKVIVSTDDDEISAIAAAHGAEVPFRRPAELADDHTPTVPVIAHAIEACHQMGWPVAYACCIYPGVPFLDVQDLERAFASLDPAQATYSFPVTEFPSAIQRALRRLPEGRMQAFHPEYELMRTQDLEPAYHDAGQFYWAAADTWLTNKRIHNNGIGVEIPSWRVVDIDTPNDWERAELLYNALMHRGYDE
jgi:pseudaminic acid cytidylyltransferase